jgi:GNAT superfamily N-acetyltransferase
MWPSMTPSYVRRMTTIDTPVTPAAPTTCDEDRALAALTAAFRADPVIRWLYPDDQVYLRAFPQLARLMGGDAFVAGTAELVADGAGVALWVSPDVPSADEGIESLIETSIDEARIESVYELLEQVGAHHPDEPVWYLPFVGVEPSRQGQGLGAALVGAGLTRARADGLPAYLEASTPRNRSLYERLGFEVAGEIRAADSPPLWPMFWHEGGAR